LKRTFFSDDATLGNAFEREARTLARLRHPVLPKVSDHFTEEGTQYLVMDHIAGEDISKRLESMQKPFPTSWVLFWADQLLDALTYLHTNEPPIIHRDIKPQNLKLTDENHIVLLDFGLSKNTIGDTRITTTGGSVVGYTPHYAPMEQISGTGTDARSDIYSLSATLYQILTNAVPPDALTRAENLINGMPDPIKPINELNPEVSKAVSDVILTGMSISQEKRYLTARQMQKALREAYVQMNSDTSAQSVVPASSSQTEISQTKQSGEMSNTSLSSQTPSQPTATPTPSNLTAAQTNQHIHSSHPRSFNQSGQDFDQTLRYDSQAENSSPKQSSIKTEVFSVDSTPATTSKQEENFAQSNEFLPASEQNKKGTFNQVNGFAAEENFEPNTNFSPGVTEPLISFDSPIDNAQTNKVLNFDSYTRQQTNNSSDGGTFIETGNNLQSGKVSTPVQPLPLQKSSSKTLAIGGLAAFLILVISAAGIGWYAFNVSGKTAEVITSTPTPKPEVSVEPSVEPKFEVVTDTNTSIGSEALTSDTNTSNTKISDIKLDAAPTKTARQLPTVPPTPIRPTVTQPKPSPPKPPQQVVQANRSRPPVKTPTPAKKPKEVIIVQ
ncbi:MAG: serine/threonine protein kinase, partial [Acidobacteriota bacterium]|nr:serine/threonine protein kinase [Acidobacteriota bacterium]